MWSAGIEPCCEYSFRNLSRGQTTADIKFLLPYDYRIFLYHVITKNIYNF